MRETPRHGAGRHPFGHLAAKLTFLVTGVVATALVVVAALGASAMVAGVVMRATMLAPFRRRRVSASRPVRAQPRIAPAGSRMTWHSRAGRVAGAGVAALLLAVTGAVADVSGPDETPAQAYGPMQPGATYAGTFTSEGDVDHLSFKVDRAGETLHFTIANTDRDCPSPYPVECAVWGTLVDGAGQQLGGEGSSAGTGEVDPGARDTIDWTFAQPGTYYLAMDSGGKLPSYTVRYDERVAPVIGSLSVRSPQRGHVVTARATFGQPLRSLKARLVAYRRTSHGSVPIGFGSLTRTDVPAGTRTLKVALNRAGRQGLARAGRVRLRLRITATPQSGATVVQSRLLTLRR